MNIQFVFSKYNNLPRSIKASLWFLVCSFLQKGISVITTPIFTRLLSTDEYGQFNIFNSWMSIISVFVTLNLSQAVYTQGLIKFPEERKIYTSSLQALSLVLISFWTLIYFVFHDFFNCLFSLNTFQMLSMFILMWTTSVFGFWSAEQRVKLNYRILVVLTLVVSLLKPVIGIVLVMNTSNKVNARILGLVISELICFSWLFFIHMKQGKVFCSSKFWKYALRINIPLIPHYLSQTALNSVDRIMIKQMVGDSESGIYSLAYSLSFMMTLFNTAMMATLSPWIYQKIKDKKEKEISKIAYLALLFVAAINLLLILLAPEIVYLFAPKSYYDAIYVIPPITMSVFFLFAYDFFAKFEFYFEKTKLVAVATVISAIMNIVFNYVFISIFGYYAAGYTTLICYILYSFFHYIMMKRICNIYMNNSKVFNSKILLFMSLAFIGSGFLLMLLYQFTFIRYLIILIISIIIFIYRKLIICKAKELLLNNKKTTENQNQ